MKLLNRKYNLKAKIARSEDGEVLRAVIVSRDAPADDSERKIFLMSQEDGRLIFRRLAVPLYLLSNAKKKLDLAGDWNAEFARAAADARKDGRTTLDIDRLHTLWQSVRNVAGSDAPIVEIGVFRGGSSRLIADAARHFGKSGRIYACDTFTGHASVDPSIDGRHTVGFFGDRTSVEDVRAYLSPYPEIEIVEGDIARTAGQIADRSVAMVHVDVDVYGATRDALSAFAGKIIPGGVIVVDDYGFVTCAGAKKAVDEFLARTGDFFALHQITGQIVLVRTGG